MLYEKTDKDFLFSNDKQKLQHGLIHKYLSEESYWAKGIGMEQVTARIEGSDCFGIYKGTEQIGFARMITDRTSFGYLCDVFILEPFRGQGLSKKLMEFIVRFEPYLHLRRILLRTHDAHGLYAQFGFKPIADADKLMEITPSETPKA
ncbi:MAG: GNAT family N-acetyltransferase [Bacteroidia bacterium]|nr:GNAT family N-acetyltransferase [Bacteroidia bacterium]